MGVVGWWDTSGILYSGMRVAAGMYVWAASTIVVCVVLLCAGIESTRLAGLVECMYGWLNECTAKSNEQTEDRPAAIIDENERLKQHNNTNNKKLLISWLSHTKPS